MVVMTLRVFLTLGNNASGEAGDMVRVTEVTLVHVDPGALNIEQLKIQFGIYCYQPGLGRLLENILGLNLK